MADRDVLICGTCSSQFSDLKIFIDHKLTCGNVVSSAGNGLETSSILSAPQQTSPVGSQQILLTAGAPVSIVSHPVGVPHVILQTSVGQSQMYRIVLEPSFNSTAQINPNVPMVTQVTQVCSSLHPSSNGVSEIQMSEKQRSVEAPPISLNEGGSVTRLSSMDPVVTQGWNSQPNQHQTSVSGLDSVDSSVMSGTEKGILGPISVGSSLHAEEEDVATILATQLVCQNAPPPMQQPPKSKESTILKYCSSLIHEVPAPVETVRLADAASKSEGFVLQEKNSQLLLPEEKSPTKQISPVKSSMRDYDTKEGVEPVSKVKEKMVCSYENCIFVTLHKKDMIRHVRKHTGEKPYKCHECGNRFSRMDKLKVHKRTHSKEKPHPCPHPGCSYRGSEKAHLTKHYRTHTDERPYRCQFCPYGAKDGSHLTVHLRSHTGDTPFHCQMEGCSAVFKTSSDLKRHEKLHTGEKPFKCSDCGYASALKANLKVHFRNNHSKGDKYGCNACSFLATSRKELRDHERVHNGRLLRYSQRVKSTPLTGSTLPPPNGKCETPHLPTVVSDVPEKRFTLSKAKRCSKPSCSKNYSCEKCGSGFVRKDSYRSHIRQHEQKGKVPEETVPCPVSRVTIQSSELESPKAKSVAALNYVLQEEGPDCMTHEILLQKEEMKTRENLQVNRCSVELGRSPPNVSSIISTATPDAFSCILTFDGISTIQPNPVTPTKTTTQSHQQLHPLVETLQSQNSPIIHVISPANSGAAHPTAQYQQS